MWIDWMNDVLQNTDNIKKEEISEVDAITKWEKDSKNLNEIQIKAAKEEFIDKYPGKLWDAIEKMELTKWSSLWEFTVNFNPEHSNFPEFIISNNWEILLNFGNVFEDKKFKDISENIWYTEKKIWNDWHSYIKWKEVPIDQAFKIIKQEIELKNENKLTNSIYNVLKNFPEVGKEQILSYMKNYELDFENSYQLPSSLDMSRMSDNELMQLSPDDMKVLGVLNQVLVDYKWINFDDLDKDLTVLQVEIVNKAFNWNYTDYSSSRTKRIITSIEKDIENKKPIAQKRYNKLKNDLDKNF